MWEIFRLITQRGKGRGPITTPLMDSARRSLIFLDHARKPSLYLRRTVDKGGL